MTPRTKRKLIVAIVLALIFSFVGCIIYLNNVYLPVRLKSELTRGLGQYLGCRVEIEKIKFNPVRGIIIENIVVSGEAEGKTETFFTVRQAYFNILYLPLITHRQIIIPVLHIDSPHLILRYGTDKKLNISRLIKPAGAGAGAEKRQPLNLMVYKINAFGGRCNFQDENLTPAFIKAAQEINIGVSLELPAKASFLTQAKIASGDGKFARVSLQGAYNLLSKRLDCTVTVIEAALKDFLPYLNSLPVRVEAGTLEDASLRLQADEKELKVKGSAEFKGLEVKKDALAIKGDAAISPEYAYSFAERSFSYQGTVRLSGCQAAGIPGYPDKVEGIAGEIAFTKDGLETKGITFETLGTPVALSGTLEGFANPRLQLKASSISLNLAKISDAFLAGKPVKLSGTAKADARIEGEAHKLPAGIQASLELSRVKAEVSGLAKPLEEITGPLELTAQSAAWKGLSFNYQGIAYASSGTVSNFQEPEIALALSSKDLNLTSALKIKDRIVKIGDFSGSYARSEFKAKGSVDLHGPRGTSAQISVDSKIRMSDLFPFIPAQTAQFLEKNKIDGTLKIKGTAGGNPSDYKNASLDLDVGSEDFTAQKLKLEGLSFELTQKNGLLDISHFAARAYSGGIFLAFTADLRPENPAYVLKFDAKGIDLARLIQDTDAKNKDIAGLLDLRFQLQGNTKSSASIKGIGGFSVKEGKLWQLNLFKGLGELLLLPQYRNIVFNQARGDLLIEEDHVWSDELEFTSKELRVKAHGKTGFNGSLDYTAYLEANKALIVESADIRKFTAAVFGELSSALSIKIGGTIQKPTYHVLPFPTDLIKQLKNFFLGK
ncbi:MAG: AsmA-like C-terminal region-containing protein [Candidatus Omnitrophica bacterium]|nr:AsmA-like C-terminal region-containing protein [Candidatus Omnitrophota bacterium]